MTIPRRYRLNQKIISLLATIEANKEVVNSVKIPIEIEENLRRQSILGSALFSARIEGNTLTRGEINSFFDLSSKDKQKIEVANLHRAINLILEKFSPTKKIATREILQLHKEVTKNILSDEFCGKFRKGHEGVFDSLGNLIYHSPPPSMIDGLIKKLIDYMNSSREKFIPIRAVLSHLGLEDVHPFVDGSGRVGRLLQFGILAINGYGMKGLVSVEELIDNNRQSYYRAIEVSRENNDATEFIELLLNFLAEASSEAKNLVIEKQKNNSPLELDTLLPRRKEIVEIIRDHQIISLDFLHRRFLKISPRLLSYDLKCLMNTGFIQKLGRTRGAMYKLKI